MDDAARAAWQRGIPIATLAIASATAWLLTVDSRHLGDGGIAQVAASAAALLTPAMAAALCAHLGLRRCAAWLAIAVGALPILVALLLLALPGPAGREARALAAFLLVLAAPLTGPPIAALVLAQLGLLGCGLRALRPGSVRGARLGAAALGVLALLSLSATGANVARYLGSPERRTALQTAARGEARMHFRRLQRCLRLVAASSPRGLPRDLALLPREGPCDVAGDLSRSFPGYDVRYEPGEPDAAGRLARFSLSVVPLDPKRRSYDGWRSDESGVVYHAPAGPEPAAADDALLGLQTLVVCIESTRLRSRDGGYPGSLEALGPEGARCLSRSGPLGEFEAALLDGEDQGHRFVYEVLRGRADGPARSYRLDVRPIAYGRPFTRSYLCDPGGRLHFTDEDRAAQASDPNLERDPVTGEERPYYCFGRAYYDRIVRQAGGP